MALALPAFAALTAEWSLWIQTQFSLVLLCRIMAAAPVAAAHCLSCSISGSSAFWYLDYAVACQSSAVSIHAGVPVHERTRGPGDAILATMPQSANLTCF